MKYKCKNCGRTYSVKTEYCDCGNNIFVEIIENGDIQPVYEQKQTASVVQDKHLQELFEDSENSEIYEDLEENQNKSSNLAKFLAVFFFLVAIIVFLIILINTFNKPVEEQKKEEKKVEIEVPSINDIWDDTLPKIEEEKEDITIYVKKKEKQKKDEITHQKNEDKKEIQSSIKPQNKSVKQDLSVKSNLQSNKNKEKSEQDINKQEEELQKKKQQDELKKQQEEIKKKQAEELQRKKQEEEKIKKEKQIKELNAYKNDIRNSLFAHFPILTVTGIGSVQIGFSIASDGRLENRRFVVQSDNKSLNDAMYHMLMRTPSVKVPPIGYNGEEIILKMDFDNGRYSFSFVK